MARRNNPSRGRKNGGGGPPAGRFRGPPRNSRPDGLGTGPYSVLAQVIQGGTSHTLADEARNTSKRPRGPLGQDAKLRYRPVTFVSAGFMNPLEELKDSPPKADDVKLDEAEPTASKADVDTIPSPAGAEPNPQEIPRDDPPVSSKEEIRPFSPSQLFTIDIAGDESLRPGRKDPVPDLPDPESDQDSDSSEEVILFKGRDAALRKAALARASASPKPRETGDSMQLHEIDVAIKVVERTITEGPPTVVKESTRQVETRRPSIPDGSPPVAPAIQEKKPMSLEALLDGNQSDEEAALIADYIANMDADEEEAQEEDDGEIDTHPGLGSHAFHLLRDLGGSDSDAIPGAVSEDENEDDDDDDDDDDDASDDEQGEEAESSQAQRRKMELGDERMARLLAKQEELGLGSDDIVLYDDADSEDGQGEWQIAPKSAPRRKKKGSSKQARIIQKKGQYPSASAMAEAFDDIDLMDWDRAALSNFNQSTQRGSQVPHVSDSELQEAMQLSFQKDRLKKAEKKKQREALRALGLLGKKMKPDDLRVKYPGGMAREDIVFELEQFLIGTDEQMSFPPFDKHARQLLHTVASHLKIKSQSSGSGESRYIVLYRTGRTLPYNERTLEMTVNRTIKRPHFQRVDVGKDVADQYLAARKNTSIKRGFNAISYREGEVVGQHANELASDNKGRLLLEKMGWSKGMALGTENNQGIMVPIGHVVKKTKAGLGDI